MFHDLRRKIISLELTPGQRLYETKLAAELRVSRTPLREALRRLVSEKLLTQLPTGGTVVRPLDSEEIKELYDVRSVLDGLAAEQASSLRTRGDIDRMSEIIERNRALVAFPEDAKQAGTALHEFLIDISGNQWLKTLNSQISHHMARYRTITNQSQKRRSAALQEHTDIAEAVAEGDSKRAKLVAEEHVKRAKQEALKTNDINSLIENIT